MNIPNMWSSNSVSFGGTFPAPTYDKIRRDNGLIGILLTRPRSETGEKILKSLEYLHLRSNEDIDLYLAGYGTKALYLGGTEVAEVNGTKWYFSNKLYVSFLNEIEKICKWEYSGESELILLSCNQGRIVYEEAIILNLDQMLREGVITSVESFFDDLFRLCREKRTIKKISNAFGIKKVKHTILKIIVEKLPAGLDKLFIQERFFCVVNIEK